MNSADRTNFLQRTLAVLGATGTAALMTLPAFAQALPTEGVVNNGDINRNVNNQSPSSTSDNCAPYTNGGVGGPIDSQSSNTQSSITQSSPSSYDTARTGIAQPNSNSNMSQSSSSATMGQSNNQMMMGSTTYNNSTYNNQGMQANANRQFDGNNRSAAVAYRANGPAGTSGHEVKMNLDAFQERQNSYPTAYNFGAPQASAAPLPVACAPR